MGQRKIIDENRVNHVAKLSRIALSEKELKLYGEQLAGILSYIEKLNEVDTQKIQPTSHPIEGLKNVFRDDKVKTSLSADEALKNAPKRKDNFFGVPKIIE